MGVEDEWKWEEERHTSQRVSILHCFVQGELALLKCFGCHDKVDLVFDVLLLLECQAEDVGVLEVFLLANTFDMGLGCFDVVEVLGVGVE